MARSSTQTPAQITKYVNKILRKRRRQYAFRYYANLFLFWALVPFADFAQWIAGRFDKFNPVYVWLAGKAVHFYDESDYALHIHNDIVDMLERRIIIGYGYDA